MPLFVDRPHQYLPPLARRPQVSGSQVCLRHAESAMTLPRYARNFGGIRDTAGELELAASSDMHVGAVYGYQRRLPSRTAARRTKYNTVSEPAPMDATTRNSSSSEIATPNIVVLRRCHWQKTTASQCERLAASKFSILLYSLRLGSVTIIQKDGNGEVEL